MVLEWDFFENGAVGVVKLASWICVVGRECVFLGGLDVCFRVGFWKGKCRFLLGFAFGIWVMDCFGFSCGYLGDFCVFFQGRLVLR